MTEQEKTMRSTATAHLLLLIAALDTPDRDKVMGFTEMLRIHTSENPTVDEEDLTTSMMEDIHEALWRNERRWLRLAQCLRPLANETR